MKPLSEITRARVVDATVRLGMGVGKGGQGVLVSGGFILTATHCIKWSGMGGMALGDYYLEPVETKSGARFRVSPWAADPVSDIATLGEPDSQEFGDDCDAFTAWREATKPVAVRPHLFTGRDVVRTKKRLPWARAHLIVEEAFPVHIVTHKGEWVAGRVARFGVFPSMPPFGSVALKVEGRIEGGTSGGPVVDGAGRLVGVVSNSGGVAGAEKHDGSIPVAHLALPRWIWARIEGDRTPRRVTAG